MSKATTIKEAVKKFEDAHNVAVADAERIELWGQIPPIEKMDATISTFKNCTYLSLSSNNIDKINSLAGLESLKTLSLGRNLIKKIENLDTVANTLEELWMSYNQLDKLSGVEKLANLTTLYLSNNRIKDWSEIDRLSVLEHLTDLLLIGNPLYNDNRENIPDYRIEVIKRLPKLKKLDGIPVDVDEKESAERLRNST